MKIALISMPFVERKYPSLALAQLKARLAETCGEEVSCSLHFLYHDFAAALGRELYDFIVHELSSGLGEWFFRRAAFPEVPDNSSLYFRSYYPGREARRSLETARERIPAILYRLAEEHALAAFDLVGFSSFFFQTTASLALARVLKQAASAPLILYGGANADFPMGNVLLRQTGLLDYVFSGPALQSLPHFLQRLQAGHPTPEQGLPGVFSRRRPAPESDEMRYGEHLPVNRLPIPDYEDFLSSYARHFPARKAEAYLFFSTSRGCYWGEKSPCTFCAQAGPGGNDKSFHSMNPENALATITALQRYAGRAHILYATDSILPRHYPREVFPRLQTRLPIHYELNTHYLDRDELRILSKQGLKVTEAGIESLFTPSLRLMGKGTTAARNLQFMRDCLLADIYVAWNFLLGFPGETVDTYMQIAAFLPSLSHFPPAQATAVGFERFSAYHTNPEKYALKLLPCPFYFLSFPFPREEIFQLAYHFENHNPAPYKEGLERCIGDILGHCRNWQALWQNPGRFIPRLYHLPGGPPYRVFDSRSGTEREHRLTSEEFRLLQALESPRPVRNLAEEFPAKVVASITTLEERGLVFKDERRLFSLVFPSKPPIPGYLLDRPAGKHD